MVAQGWGWAGVSLVWFITPRDGNMFSQGVWSLGISLHWSNTPQGIGWVGVSLGWSSPLEGWGTFG